MQTKKWAAGLGVIVFMAGVGGVGIAAAAIPDSQGVIHGCYNPQIGVLRVVDGACLRGEKSLTWNQTGPRGPSGPTGPQGATGQPGPAGPQGPAGTSLNVRDVNGNIVGKYAGGNFVLRDDGLIWTIDFGSGVWRGATVLYYFEGVNCTGNMYVVAGASPANAVMSYVGTGQFAPSSGAADVHYESYWNMGDCSNTAGDAPNAQRVTEVSRPAPAAGPLTVSQ